MLEAAEPTGPTRVPDPDDVVRRAPGRPTYPALATAATPGPVWRPGPGPGGVGKSRLAQQVAARAVDLRGGRYWVPLASVPDDTLVEATVAMALGLPVSGDEPGQDVARHLAPLGRTLLVLDGCESVRDGTATLASLLVSEAPDLTIVTTSRVPLGLREEAVIAVPPLRRPVGTDLAVLGDNPQVRLLIDRLAESGEDLVIDESVAAYVEILCHRCAGLPLALELVAAQLTAMSPADLVDHLDEASAANGDALRGIAGASLALLDTEEAAVYRRMSVLEGPSELGAVRAVCAGPDLPRVRVVRILRELGDRGLVVTDRTGARWTYSQDDDLHRLAREQLVSAGEERATLGRLLDLCFRLLPDDPRSPPGPFADAVTAMLPSVRGLLAGGVSGRVDSTRTLELAFRLHRYWASTNVGEGRYWLERLIAAHGGDGDEWTAYATYALGYLDYWAGEDLAAVPHLERAIGLLADIDGAYVARAQIFLAGILDDLDRGGEAVQLVRESIRNAAPHGADLRVSAAMGVGSVLAERADPEAVQHAAAAIELCQAHGSPEQLAACMPTAAMIAWQVGAVDRARAWVEQAMPMHVDGRRIARVVLLSAACGVHLADGDLDAAVETGRSADTEGTELGVERELPLARSLLALSLLARGEADEASERARAAVRAAAALGYTFPLAGALETTALIARARGVDVAALAPVLATAAAIRLAGDRPTSRPLAPQVDALRQVVPRTAPLPTAEAVAAALAL